MTVDDDVQQLIRTCLGLCWDRFDQVAGRLQSIEARLQALEGERREDEPVIEPVIKNEPAAPRWCPFCGRKDLTTWKTLEPARHAMGKRTTAECSHCTRRFTIDGWVDEIVDES